MAKDRNGSVADEGGGDLSGGAAETSRRDRRPKSKRKKDERGDDESTDSGGDKPRSSKKKKSSRSSKRGSRKRRRSDSDDESDSSSSDSYAESNESNGGSDSDASDSGSDDSEGEARRRRRKKERRRREREREHKRERRRREKEKKRKRKREKEKEKKKKKKDKKGSSKEKASAMQGAVTNSWGKYGIIRETDMWNKRPEFTAWLAEVKKVNLESLANWEEKQMFKDFMEDHNTATFTSKKYYDLDTYYRRKLEKEVKKGLKDVTKTERTIFDDEEQRRLELLRERERQKEGQVEVLKQSMQSGMAQAMKDQSRLREEMAYQYRIGNFEAAALIQRRLDPDVAM